jgi:hypothetical protein
MRGRLPARVGRPNGPRADQRRCCCHRCRGTSRGARAKLRRATPLTHSRRTRVAAAMVGERTEQDADLDRPGHRDVRLQHQVVGSGMGPGGNLTGVNFFAAELAAKRLGLLRELVPGAARIAVIVNPDNPSITASTLRDLEPAARAAGIQIQSSTRRAGLKSPRHSRRLRVIGSTLSCSGAGHCSPAGVFNWLSWQRTTECPRCIPGVNMSKPEA